MTEPIDNRAAPDADLDASGQDELLTAEDGGGGDTTAEEAPQGADDIDLTDDDLGEHDDDLA